MRVLIDARNLSNGGAVTVAACQIAALCSEQVQSEVSWVRKLDIHVSSRVWHEIADIESAIDKSRIAIQVLDSKGGRDWFAPQQLRWDVRYTIFGPAFGPRVARAEVAGFADGSIAPVEGVGAIGSTGLSEKVRKRIKLTSLRRYDAFIVQSVLMRDALALKVKVPIHVEPNVPGHVFRRHGVVPWNLDLRPQDGVVLFYPARGYPHKNHRILPDICAEVEAVLGRKCVAVVTLRPPELESLGLRGVKSILNVGEASAEDCARLFLASDALIFPSLNETFSSAPLEAMLMGRPAVCSNLRPVRESSGGRGFYFNPSDPASAAVAIRDALAQGSHQRIEEANRWVQSLGTPEQQAMRLMAILADRQVAS